MFGMDQRKLNRELVAKQRAKIVLYKQVFGTERGREVLMDLMNQFHVLNEHKGTEYDEGQRSVVLQIMRNTNIDVAKFDEMWKGGANGDGNQ